ncbi:MAG: ATP-binding protein [Bacteroidota bacterium]
MVIIGWATDSTVLISIAPGMTAMNPMTAIGFLLCAGSLYLYTLRHKGNNIRHLQRAISFVVLLMGAVKLLEYAGVLHIYFDRWLFTDKLRTRYGFNAIAPNTALLFSLAGTLFLISYRRSAISRQVNDIIKLSGVMIAYLGIIGYLYSIRTAYQIGPFVPMALNTACCFIAIYMASFLALPQGRISSVLGSNNAGGKLGRRAIPFLLLLPVFFGYLRLKGEQAGLFEAAYGTALSTAAVMVLMFLMVYSYARQLNKKEKEKAQATFQITKSEEKYRTLVDTLKEGVVYFDREGKIMFCNNSFTEITGYTAGNIGDKGLIGIVCQNNDVAAISEKLDNVRQVHIDDFEMEIVHKDGYRLWVSVAGRPVYGNADVKAAFFTITDITEKKKVIEDLKSFISFAAHDLRSPVSRIEMLAQAMFEDEADLLSADGKENLQLILRTTGEANAMLGDVLRLAKLNADSLDKREVKMREMVQETVDKLHHINPVAIIKVEHLPTVIADGAALKQVWANLISNALKYSSKKINPQILIGCIQKNAKNVYYVRDNGAGFDMEKATNLFTPFSRVHTDFEGHGLGLPIVKRIIEKHNGQIWVDAVEGQGATFFFTI